MTLRFAHRTYVQSFRHPLRTAHGVWSSREGLLVRLQDEEGRIGFGEMAPIPGFGDETALDLASHAASLGDYIDEETLLRAFPAGSGRFAINNALRGLGRLPALPALQKSLPVAALLPAGRKCRDVLAERLQTGFRTFKWKVGVESIADELVLLDELLGELPTGAKLRLDANGSWDRRSAERWLNAAADRPIDFIEQPAAADDADLLLGLANDFPTPLALDEAISSETDLEFWLGEGWPGVWVMKASLLANPEDWVASIRARKGRVIFSTAIEGPVGRRDALAVAFAQESLPEAIGFGVGQVFDAAAWNPGEPRPFLFASELSVDAEALWNSLT